MVYAMTQRTDSFLELYCGLQIAALLRKPTPQVYYADSLLIHDAAPLNFTEKELKNNGSSYMDNDTLIKHRDFKLLPGFTERIRRLVQARQDWKGPHVKGFTKLGQCITEFEQLMKRIHRNGVYQEILHPEAQPELMDFLNKIIDAQYPELKKPSDAVENPSSNDKGNSPPPGENGGSPDVDAAAERNGNSSDEEDEGAFPKGDAQCTALTKAGIRCRRKNQNVPRAEIPTWRCPPHRGSGDNSSNTNTQNSSRRLKRPIDQVRPGSMPGENDRPTKKIKKGYSDPKDQSNRPHWTPAEKEALQGWVSKEIADLPTGHLGFTMKAQKAADYVNEACNSKGPNGRGHVGVENQWRHVDRRHREGKTSVLGDIKCRIKTNRARQKERPGQKLPYDPKMGCSEEFLWDKDMDHQQNFRNPTAPSETDSEEEEEAQPSAELQSETSEKEEGEETDYEEITP